ncbi:MAG: porphobilinogen synthase, partial [Betaproteobacteria bacterium AqS2]|nr:porphobilinogen synthase [Betaproteobacteria bacterium AqS2]
MKLPQRPRRLRSGEAIRRLVREHSLSSADLIWPLFVHAAKGCEDIAAMPGVQRLDEDGLLRACEDAVKAGIPCVALFPATDPALRSDDGAEAYNDEGLVQRLVRRVKKEQPGLLLLTDVALDPYTSHGHDGVLDAQGRVANDETVEILVRQALSLAGAGADIIAPSDMMDGRVGAIRAGLEESRLVDVKIMSYAAKYASAFYGPFRSAIKSDAVLKGDKRTYQMDSA